MPIERVRRHEVTVFGRAVSYVERAGGGIPVLLVHGMGASSQTWGPVPQLLAGGRRVLAVDLPGHGCSDAGPGDYSLGAMASTMRDLLDLLDIEQVHIVGHSLGGGVALQFAYQFPDKVASLTLESSGGLGKETFAGLRAASLPGADLVLRLLASDRVQTAAAWLGGRLAQVGLQPDALSDRALGTLAALRAPERRSAFLATLRSVVGPDGQRVSALERLERLDGRRVLIVWGDRDPVIPPAHGRFAHELLPGSRLVVFGGAGHEPHVDDPVRFAELVDVHVDAWEESAAYGQPGGLVRTAETTSDAG